MIYFDHNATSGLLPAARQAWLDATEQYPGNPSSPHRLGTRAEAALQAARAQLAGWLGCEALDVVWTSGATESNNLVFHHLAAVLPPEGEVWVAGLEHPSVLEAARHHLGRQLQLIPVLQAGTVDLAWLQRGLAGRSPALVAVMAANNETGVQQPWPEVLALCHRYGTQLFCDAVQWIGKRPAAGLGQCDFVSGSAHKFGGPRGVGFLKCPNRSLVRPLLLGGPQEDGRRAGTENVPGVLAMMAALAVRERQLAAREHEGRANWREQFENALLARVPGAELVGATAPRLWNTVSALMPQRNCQQRWVVKLDKAGFAVSTGSACASGQEEPSHVLSAMGYAPPEAARVLRFSSGWETTAADWEALLEAVAAVHATLA